MPPQLAAVAKMQGIQPRDAADAEAPDVNQLASLTQALEALRGVEGMEEQREAIRQRMTVMSEHASADVAAMTERQKQLAHQQA
eukprot:7830238-Alexandrium_andersonii.AAC.1